MHDQSVTVSSPFTRNTTTPEDSPNSSSIDFMLPGCFFRSCSLVDPSRLIGCESALAPTFPSNSTRQHGVPVLDSSNITSSEWEYHGSLGFFWLWRQKKKTSTIDIPSEKTSILHIHRFYKIHVSSCCNDHDKSTMEKTVHKLHRPTWCSPKSSHFISQSSDEWWSTILQTWPSPTFSLW